jgi:hypothetical protein
LIGSIGSAGAAGGAGAAGYFLYDPVAEVIGLPTSEYSSAGAGAGAAIGMAVGGPVGSLVGALLGGIVGGSIGPDPSKPRAYSKGSVAYDPATGEFVATGQGDISTAKTGAWSHGSGGAYEWTGSFVSANLRGSGSMREWGQGAEEIVAAAIGGFTSGMSEVIAAHVAQTGEAVGSLPVFKWDWKTHSTHYNEWFDKFITVKLPEKMNEYIASVGASLGYGAGEFEQFIAETLGGGAHLHGSPYIEESGLHYLHEGEAVTNADEAAVSDFGGNNYAFHFYGPVTPDEIETFIIDAVERGHSQRMGSAEYSETNLRRKGLAI